MSSFIEAAFFYKFNKQVCKAFALAIESTRKTYKVYKMIFLNINTIYDIMINN